MDNISDCKSSPAEILQIWSFWGKSAFCCLPPSGFKGRKLKAFKWWILSHTCREHGSLFYLIFSFLYLTCMEIQIEESSGGHTLYLDSQEKEKATLKYWEFQFLEMGHRKFLLTVSVIRERTSKFCPRCTWDHSNWSKLQLIN